MHIEEKIPAARTQAVLEAGHPEFGGGVVGAAVSIAPVVVVKGMATRDMRAMPAVQAASRPDA